MTRKSEREIDRAVEDLAAELDVEVGDPVELLLTHRVVETDATAEYDGAIGGQTRVWRDETGEWHSEELEEPEEFVDVDGASPERRADR